MDEHMSYVFGDKELAVMVKNPRGDGTISMETLYKGFKNRMIEEDRVRKVGKIPDKIEVIKQIRGATGAPLKAAKDLYEDLERQGVINRPQ